MLSVEKAFSVGDEQSAGNFFDEPPERKLFKGNSLFVGRRVFQPRAGGAGKGFAVVA